MLILFCGKFGQQSTHRLVFRRRRGAPVESRGLKLHFLGKLAGGIERQWTVQPDRTPRYEAFDVLPPDERQEVAKLFEMKREQGVAMADLLLGHLVVHFGG